MKFPISDSSSSTSTPEASASTSTPPAAPTPRALPPDHPPVPAGVESCPVDDSARAVWISAAEQAQSSTSPQAVRAASQRPLSQDREISSIPRGAGTLTRHNTDSPEQGHSEAVEHDAKGKWVYPSEQQFFNAMLRKNHDPKVADMRTIVPIHNAVNEKAWEEVLKWEAGMGGEKCPGGVKLSSFVGRPQERSPKAWLKTVFGYTPPFDRHDWYVDRCGTQVRYVIDFYTGRPDAARPGNMSFYLDVRPAVDNWAGVYTRVSGLWR